MRYIAFGKDGRIKPISVGVLYGWQISKGLKRVCNAATIMLGYKGSMSVTIDSKEYLLERGSFQVLFPGTVFSSEVQQECEHAHFCCSVVLPKDSRIIEDDEVEEALKQDCWVLPEFAKVNDCEKYFVIFSQLMDEMYNLRLKEPFKTEICDNYTKILLCSMADAAMRYNGGNKKRMFTEKIFYYLKRDVKKRLGASGVAKELNYNADYLNQIVKKETGMTLTKYLNTLRLEEAKSLLLNSDMRIYEIATEVGFTDEKYFMKIFKAYEKITPKQYREAYIGKMYSSDEE